MRLAILFMTALGMSAASAGISNEIDLFVETGRSFLWRTASNSTCVVEWELPAGAVSATLAVSGFNGEKVLDVTGLPGTAMEFGTPDSPDTENVYDLTLTFDCGESNIVRRGQIGVVRAVGDSGADGATADIRCPATAWSVLSGSHAVLPVPAGTADFSIDGVGVETGLDGAAGWYGWKKISVNPSATGSGKISS